MSRSWLMASSVAATVVIAALAAAGSEAGPTAFPGRNGTILAGGGVKGKLYALSADGRRRTEIRGVRTAEGSGPAASSPDGTKFSLRPPRRRHLSPTRPVGIRYASRRGVTSPPGLRTDPRSSSPGATGCTSSEPMVAASAASSPAGTLKWSPDGTRIAFGSRERSLDDIYVAALDGSGRVRLTTAWSGECYPLGPLYGGGQLL